MRRARSQEFEPADRPVQLYESLLCLLAQGLVFASRATHAPLVERRAGAAIALLLIMSLWKLLLPPRVSATRCAFLLIGLICIVVLVSW